MTKITMGSFTLEETESENQLRFYRNDGGVVGNVGRIPMDFYQHYITEKMFSGEITDMVMNDIHFEQSDDGKCIILTVFKSGEGRNPKIPKKSNKPADTTEKQPNFFKRFFKKILG